MNRLTNFGVVVALAMCIFGCSDSETNSEEGDARTTSMVLPLADAGSEQIEGKVTFWMWEGDAGCYGELEISGKPVNVWAEADLCVDEDVQEGAVASFDILLDSQKQSYLSADGSPTYGIVGFY